MSGYRLAAIDIDGTLVRSDRSVSDRTRAAVRGARAAGLETVLVTARHPAAIADIAAAADVTGRAICCLGAALCELPSGRVAWSRSLRPDAVAEIARRVHACLPGTHLGWVLEGGPLGYEPGYPGPLLVGTSYRGSPAAVQAPVLKMWAVGDALDGSPPEVLAGALAGYAEVAHYGRGFVDLVAPGVSKVASLELVCRESGASPASVVAFGDTEADLAMLRWAGLGVVMANADPELHRHGDIVAPHCDEDGVAVVLEQLTEQMEPT